MVLKGYFYPPKTGKLMFAIATDDPGQLYFSTDDNFANKTLIASESQWSPVRAFGGAWDGTSATRRNVITTGDAPIPRPENWSAYIQVKEGKPYYIEGVATEFGGGDNLAIAYRYEGDADFVDGGKPIPGKYLAPFYASDGVIMSKQDLWDVSNGTIVTTVSGAYPSFDPTEAFGATKGPESGTFVFADNTPNLRFIEWKTSEAITLDTVRLFADPVGIRDRHVTSFSLYYRPSKNSALWVKILRDEKMLPTGVISTYSIPYFEYSIPPIKSDEFRAEFNGGGLGARIFELDAFGPLTARAQLQVVNGFIVGATIVNGGDRYETLPNVRIEDSTGSGAAAIATLSGGKVSSIQITKPGRGYSANPVMFIDPPPPLEVPARRAEAAALVVGGFVVGLDLTLNGSGGYLNPPLVRIVGGGGTGATATAQITDGIVTGLTVIDPGSGYTSTPAVIIGDLPFSIVTQPTTQLVSLGGEATLLVQASGEGPFAYQWFLNGVAVAGATQPTLSISGVDLAKTGKYTVVVTGPGGSLTSAPATLVSEPELDLGIYAGLTLKGTVGQTYTIEYTPDIKNDALWKPLDQVTLTSPTQFWLDFGSVGSPKRFYRATPVF